MDQIQNTEMNTKINGDVDIQDIQDIQPKKRGRPLGSKNKKKDDSGTDSDASSADEKKVKKKRGRPVTTGSARKPREPASEEEKKFGREVLQRIKEKQATGLNNSDTELTEEDLEQERLKKEAKEQAKKRKNELKEKKNWILSYNDCEEIRHLYRDYEIKKVSWTYGMKNVKSKKVKEKKSMGESSEIIIIGDK